MYFGVGEGTCKKLRPFPARAYTTLVVLVWGKILMLIIKKDSTIEMGGHWWSWRPKMGRNLSCFPLAIWLWWMKRVRVNLTSFPTCLICLNKKKSCSIFYYLIDLRLPKCQGMGRRRPTWGWGTSPTPPPYILRNLPQKMSSSLASLLSQYSMIYTETECCIIYCFLFYVGKYCVVEKIYPKTCISL